MNKVEFGEEYQNIVRKALQCSNKARKEGLLSLEDSLLDHEKANTRDIFEYGMRFVVDGIDAETIDEILSNIINQEKDEQLRILKNIQKQAVMGIQCGLNPRILYAILNSLTDISLNEDKMHKLLDESVIEIL